MDPIDYQAILDQLRREMADSRSQSGGGAQFDDQFQAMCQLMRSSVDQMVDRRMNWFLDQFAAIVNAAGKKALHTIAAQEGNDKKQREMVTIITFEINRAGLLQNRPQLEPVEPSVAGLIQARTSTECQINASTVDSQLGDKASPNTSPDTTISSSSGPPTTPCTNSISPIIKHEIDQPFQDAPQLSSLPKNSLSFDASSNNHLVPHQLTKVPVSSTSSTPTSFTSAAKSTMSEPENPGDDGPLSEPQMNIPLVEQLSNETVSSMNTFGSFEATSKKVTCDQVSQIEMARDMAALLLASNIETPLQTLKGKLRNILNVLDLLPQVEIKNEFCSTLSSVAFQPQESQHTTTTAPPSVISKVQGDNRSAVSMSKSNSINRKAKTTINKKRKMPVSAKDELFDDDFKLYRRVVHKQHFKHSSSTALTSTSAPNRSSFSSRVSMSSHQSNRPVRKFITVHLTCPYPACSMLKFALEDALSTHLDKLHKGMRYRCLAPNCEAAFWDRSLLDKHLRQLHSNLRLWPCPHCPFSKMFESFEYLQKHIHANHGGRFRCVKSGCAFVESESRYAIEKHYDEVHA